MKRIAVYTLGSVMMFTSCEKHKNEVAPASKATLQARWLLTREDLTVISVDGAKTESSFVWSASSPGYLSFDETMWKYSGIASNAYYNYTLQDSLIYRSHPTGNFPQMNDTLSIVELTSHSLILRQREKLTNGNIVLSKSKYSRQ